MTDNLPVLVEVEAVEIGAVSGSTPKQLVANAVLAANELAEIITSRALFSNIQGKRYVRCEGWTTLAAIMGCLPREVEVTEKDGTYVAIVELHRIRDDALMGRASAECGVAEPTWKSRAPYARRSMAVTRATSKACRIAFSWVMTLAGFEVTPAEEMPRDEDRRPSEPKQLDSEPLPRPRPTGGMSDTPSSLKQKQEFQKIAPLKQSNIDMLLTKADGRADEVFATVERIMHVEGVTRDAKTWPKMNLDQYHAIVLAIETLDPPEAVTITDLCALVDAKLKDQSVAPAVRVRVLSEYQGATARDDMTVEQLRLWLKELSQ